MYFSYFKAICELISDQSKTHAQLQFWNQNLFIHSGIIYHKYKHLFTCFFLIFYPCCNLFETFSIFFPYRVKVFNILPYSQGSIKCLSIILCLFIVPSYFLCAIPSYNWDVFLLNSSYVIVCSLYIQTSTHLLANPLHQFNRAFKDYIFDPRAGGTFLCVLKFCVSLSLRLYLKQNGQRFGKGQAVIFQISRSTGQKDTAEKPLIRSCNWCKRKLYSL